MGKFILFFAGLFFMGLGLQAFSSENTHFESLPSRSADVHPSKLQPSHSPEITRFEFMQKLGEGDVAIYRLDLDVKAGSGLFCFADSAGSEINMEVRDRIYGGVPWWRLIDMSKITHSCATIFIYKPFGRFYTPRMKYGALKEEYVFVYIGAFEEGKMEGVMYEFTDLPTGEGAKVIRSPDEFDVNVVGKK